MKSSNNCLHNNIELLGFRFIMQNTKIIINLVNKWQKHGMQSSFYLPLSVTLSLLSFSLHSIINGTGLYVPPPISNKYILYATLQSEKIIIITIIIEFYLVSFLINKRTIISNINIPILE